MANFTVGELRVGRVAPLGPQGIASGIAKRPLQGPVQARFSGLDGDEQGDTRHHGGLDKAIHAYPESHYPLWRRELPEQAATFQPGGFGENLVIKNATEANLCLFDRYRLGGALVEVSQTRQPCWRLNLRFGLPKMARRVQKTGRTGWYFRVISEGMITRGDCGKLVARPQPDWPLDRVWRLLYVETMDVEALTAFAALPDLPERWRRMAETRLARHSVEDWDPRLETPE